MALSGKQKLARFWEPHRHEREAAYMPAIGRRPALWYSGTLTALRWVEGVRNARALLVCRVDDCEVCDHPSAQGSRTLPRPPRTYRVVILDAGTAKRPGVPRR